jgi:hypothetical protein
MNKSKFLAFIIFSQLLISTNQLSVAQVANNRTRGEINQNRTNNIPTQIDLVQYAPQLNGVQPCVIDIIVDDNTKINQVMTKGSMHSFILPIFSDTIKNPKITFRGPRDGMRSSRACPVIVDINLAVIKESMWRTWEAKSNPTIVNCIKNNLNKVGLNYPLNSYGEGIGIPFNTEFIKLEHACQKAIGQFDDLKEYSCPIQSKILKVTYNGTCVDKLVIRNLNGNSQSNELNEQVIISNESHLIDALLSFKMIGKARFESDLSRVERLKEEEKFILQEKLLAEKNLKEEQRIAEKKIEDAEKKRLETERIKLEIAAEIERKRKWDESPEGKKALAQKIEEEKLIAKKIELERKKNFLLGLCEIPVKSKLNECSRDAILNSDDAVESYWVFTDTYVSYAVMSTNKVPREARIEKNFSVHVNYEVNESRGEVTAKISDDKHQCITQKLYKKTLLGISVTNLGLSGKCSEVAKMLNAREEKNYSMKYKKHTN